MVNNLPDNVDDGGDVGFISGSRRYPGEGNGNLLQYYSLENSMAKEAWKAMVHGVTKTQI